MLTHKCPQLKESRKQKTGKLFWQSSFYDTTMELKKKTNFANEIKFQTELYEIQQRHQLLPSCFNMPGHTCTYSKLWRHISKRKDSHFCIYNAIFPYYYRVFS